MAFIPTPDQFPTWQEWAQHVVDVLSNDSGSTGTGSSPSISTQPPIKKILIAASGAYSTFGADVEFLHGPFQHVMSALRGAYGLTGNDVQLLHASLTPFDAASGSFVLSGGNATFSAAQGLPTQGSSVVTYHSIGLYWQPVDENGNAVVPANNAVKIQYRRAGEASWHQGHDLWYDPRQINGRPKEARGSIVYCIPDTDYTVQFGLTQSDGSTKWIAQLTTHTWIEVDNLPIGTSVSTWSGDNSTLQSGSYATNGGLSAVLLATRSGNASGYTLYDFTGKNASATAPNADRNHCVYINGHHIIVRGLKCNGGGRYGVFIEPGSSDIIVDDLDISGWGFGSSGSFQVLYPGNATSQTTTSYNRSPDEFGGIALQPDPGQWGGKLTSRVTIQRCKIHNPLYGANPWDYGHPVGSTAIMCYDTGGNHVLRYNESYSTVPNPDGSDPGYSGTPLWSNFFEDSLMMGGNNFSNVGSPGPDSDIYKNICMHGMDDGFECEGGGMNIRVWGNYIDFTATGPASTSVAIGPAYFFRNVYNRCRDRYQYIWGSSSELSSDRLGMFKAGSDSLFGNGRRYVYHNTAMQYPDPNGGFSLGSAYGISDAKTDNGTVGLTQTVSRNNVLETVKNWGAIVVNSGGNNDFDYDMTNLAMGVSESNGKTSTVNYQAGNGPTAQWTGKYRLDPSSPGWGTGAKLNNFNNDVDAPFQFIATATKTAPDRGAHEDGTGDMVFGVAAAGTGA